MKLSEVHHQLSLFLLREKLSKKTRLRTSDALKYFYYQIFNQIYLTLKNVANKADFVEKIGLNIKSRYRKMT